MSQVDGQTGQSRVEREGESTFNLAEAALLGSRSSSSAGGHRDGGPAVPTRRAATRVRAANGFCPNPAQLRSATTGSGQVDFDASDDLAHVRA